MEIKNQDTWTEILPTSHCATSGQQFELSMPQLTDLYNTDVMMVLTLIELGRSNEPHQTQSAWDSAWHVLKHLIDVSLIFMVRVVFPSC